MKTAVILHGTDGSPEENWFPWLKAKFEAEGYDVWVPQLPECHTPNRDIYNNFLLETGRDLTGAIVVGHSSGAVEVLNLLMDKRCPKIHLGVMVGAWAGGLPKGYPEDGHQFDHLFPRWGFRWRRIRSKADKLAFLHGNDDPYCPIEQAESLATLTRGSLTIVPNGGHLGSDFRELPQVWELIVPHLQ
ncbi:hypothetical protein EYC59_02435 [Candidatus Saccharibacteria bacterium]|nr:MAG: hypothetical protein EYC59_02435 [Candidatus Saccharibacteria bacterium]